MIRKLRLFYKRFFTQAWLQFKSQNAAFNLEEFVFFQTAQPLLTLIFYCLLASYSFNTNNLTRWVIGNSFLLCINTCVFSLGISFTRERYFGTLRSIIVSPINKLLIILQNSFFPMIIAIITVCISIGLGSLIFNIDLSSINLLLFFLIIIIAMFAASSFGMLLSVLGLITDSMHFILNLSSYLLMIFCGSNFPISQLPYLAQLFSKMLPLTRSIEVAQGLLSNSSLFTTISNEKLTQLLLEEIIIGIIYCIISFLIIKIAEKIAIKKATLDAF